MSKSPLQNRVDPLGQLHAVPSKAAAMMGNKGILHDKHQNVVRPWVGKSWVACDPHFQSIDRRPLFQPNRYSELFFLDEATAYSAGHRPCWYCQRDSYSDLKTRWMQLFSAGAALSIQIIDAQLHKERAIRGGGKLTYQAKLADLPYGTFVHMDERAFLVHDRRLLEWSFDGYVVSISLEGEKLVEVLTPWSIVELFKQGLRPKIHSSGALCRAT